MISKKSLCSLFLLVLIIIMPLTSHTYEFFNGWDIGDKGLYVASLAASAADMITTHRAIEDGGYERNPLLPEHPSPGRLAGHWLLCAAGKYVIADLLPGQWRKSFLAGCVAIDIALARENSIRFEYRF